MNKKSKGANIWFAQMIIDFLLGLFLMAVIAGLVEGFERIFLYFPTGIAFSATYVLVNKAYEVYDVTKFFYMDGMIKTVTRSFLVAAAFLFAIVFAADKGGRMIWLCVYYCVSGYFPYLGVALLHHHLHGKRNSHKPRTLLLGEIKSFKKFESFMERTNIKIFPVGYVSMTPEDEEGYIGKAADLERIIREQSIDQVYIMQNARTADEIQPYVDICMEMGITVHIVMNLYDSYSAVSYVSSLGTFPVLTCHTVSLNGKQQILKRCMDIMGSVAGIIVFLPVMLIAAICIMADLKGQILFKQTRVGRNGRRFTIYKFRTMCVDADKMKSQYMSQNEMADHFMFKMKEDPRITRCGRFLRKTSLDELPQFFNILKGDMSLVGTRPPTLDEVERYERNHWRRISIKPGLTGMWQVSGRSDIRSFDEIVELDTKYIDNWSIWLDIKIILRTFFTVLKGKGAS